MKPETHGPDKTTGVYIRMSEAQKATLCRRAAQRNMTVSDYAIETMQLNDVNFEPSEEQIKSACEEIRKGWSSEVTKSRRVTKDESYVDVKRATFPRDYCQEPREKLS